MKKIARIIIALVVLMSISFQRLFIRSFLWKTLVRLYCMRPFTAKMHRKNCGRLPSLCVWVCRKKYNAEFVYRERYQRFVDTFYLFAFFVDSFPVNYVLYS